jgi:hypothetical protein
MQNKFDKKLIVKSVAIILLATLCSCRDAAEKMGIGKANSPDEFLVVSHPPLATPPNFSLPNPHAKKAMLPERATRTGAKVSEEEKAFLQKMERKNHAETSDGEEEMKHFIDPFSEKERLEKNKQQGLPINEGEVKEMPKAKPSTLQKIFGH